MVMVVSLGVIVLFGFFAVLGLFSPAEVLWLSAGMVVMATILTVYTLAVRREMERHGNQDAFRPVNRLRERRGF
jgi:hypothetical protein